MLKLQFARSFHNSGIPLCKTEVCPLGIGTFKYPDANSAIFGVYELCLPLVREWGLCHCHLNANYGI
jgi:hypothetical protein